MNTRLSAERLAMWAVLLVGLLPGAHALATGATLGAESSLGLLVALFAAAQLVRRS